MKERGLNVPDFYICALNAQDCIDGNCDIDHILDPNRKSSTCTSECIEQQESISEDD